MNAIQLRQETLEVSVRPDAVAARDEALSASQCITAIADELDEADASEVLKDLVRMERGVESTRTAIKAPLLDAGRKVDGIAREFSSPITSEVARLKGLLAKFDAARRERIAAEEAKRQAEARRIEQEKAAAEAALKLQQEQAAAAAEKARQAAEAEFMASDKAEQEKAALEAAQAQRQAAEEQAKADKAKADKAKADAAQLQITVQQPEKAPSKPKGIASRMVWKVEVTDIKALYAARPDLVTMEPKIAAIERVVSAGVELPGVRAWKEAEVSVRV